MQPLKSHPEAFTIVVTDSGLGGLSVAADLEQQLRAQNHFGKINILFFNALAASNFGYNSMPNAEKKAEVFDAALNAIETLYKPDLILIACNTLSVVFEQTAFAKKNSANVLGIIDLGVDMILEKLGDNLNETLLLLGTPTTITSHSYHKRLAAKGVKEESIIDQPCPLLETAIQQNPESEVVHQMITEFLTQAKTNELINSEKLAVALCCTHYGYSENIFRESVEKIFQKAYTMINPNRKMVEYVVEKLSTRKIKTSEISVNIVSQVKLKETEIISIAGMLRTISPVTASALVNYDYNESLFRFNIEKL